MGFQEEYHREEPTLSSFHIKDIYIYYWHDLSLLMFTLITGLRLLLLFTHSVVSDSFWPHGLQHTRLPCPSLSPRVCSNYVHWISDAIQPPHPLLSPSSSTFNLSQHQVPFNESALCIRWSKYWSFSISPFNEYSGFISFRIDWFDLLAVQMTFKSLL